MPAWTAAGATGASTIQGCGPDCAEGSETPVTTITLSVPGNGMFTAIGEIRYGTTFTFSYPPVPGLQLAKRRLETARDQ